MLSLHVLLTMVAVMCLPGVYIVGRHMRKIMFPLSFKGVRAKDINVLGLILLIYIRLP